MRELCKAVLHNIGVVILGFVFAFAGTAFDHLLRITPFHFVLCIVLGALLVLLGFLLRVWATWYFYRARMKVIVLHPQQRLITGGPYRFSRNPLYLGGNVFIFLGAVLCLGSPSGVVLTALNIVFFDRLIRREERQLQQTFGEQWTTYRATVRRWI